MGLKGKILIAGLGNPLMGDDGAGVAVARALKKKGLPPGVNVLEGEMDGLSLLERAEGFDLVIVVDAADMKLEPGEWRAFELKPGLLKDELGISAHQFGLGEALRLAEKLGWELPPIKIYGIQPERIGFTGKLQLSGAVAKAVRAVVEALRQELEALRSPNNAS